MKGAFLSVNSIGQAHHRVPHILWLAFAAYVAILPIGATTALRNLAFVVVWSALGYLLWRARQRPSIPVGLPWLAYLLPALLSLATSVDLQYSLGEIKSEIAIPFLIFIMTATIIHDELTFLRFLRIAIVANLFLVVFSLTTAIVGATTKDDLIGTLNTGVGYYSTYLVAVMPFIALFRWYSLRQARSLVWGLGLLILANLASLYVTGNRQGFVALMAELAVFIIFYGRALGRRQWTILVASCVSIGALFVVQFLNRDASATKGLGSAMGNDVRWPVWQACVQVLADHPWKGSGFGLRIFQIAFPQFSANGPFWHAHNVLLNKGMQMGIPGILGFLFLFFSIPARMLSGLRSGDATKAVAVTGIAMSAGFLLKNMTDDFFYRESGYMFWLLSGAVLGFLRTAVADSKVGAKEALA